MSRSNSAGDRDLGYSYEELQPYFVVDGYGVTVRRQIVGRFDACGSVLSGSDTAIANLVFPGDPLSRLRAERRT